MKEELYEPTPLEYRALMQFASTDETRPHVCALARFGGWVWATDGHCAARIRVGIDDSKPARMHSTDGGTTWHPADEDPWTFPPCEKVYPPMGRKGGLAAFNPAYITRLVMVEKAVRARFKEEFTAKNAHRCKAKSFKAELDREMLSVGNISIPEFGGELDPIRFTCGKGEGSTRWDVIIMPRKL